MNCGHCYQYLILSSGNSLQSTSAYSIPRDPPSLPLIVILILFHFLFACPLKKYLETYKGKAYLFLARKPAFSFLISQLQTSQAFSCSASLPCSLLLIFINQLGGFSGIQSPSKKPAFSLYLTSEIVPFVFSAIKDLVGVLSII